MHRHSTHHASQKTSKIYLKIDQNPLKWASKELAEFLEYCYEDQIDTQEIGGSYAGAFGFGQFIPSSFNNYSVDFNEDGSIIRNARHQAFKLVDIDPLLKNNKHLKIKNIFMLNYKHMLDFIKIG